MPGSTATSSRPDDSQRRRHAHPPLGDRRRRRLPRQAAAARRRTVERRLHGLHDPFRRAQGHRHRLRADDEERDRQCPVRLFEQDRLRGSALLGEGGPDLRRHLVRRWPDQPRLVSLGRPAQRRAGCSSPATARGPKRPKFQQRPIVEQIEFARGVVDKLHPGHGKRSRQRHRHQLAQGAVQPRAVARLQRRQAGHRQRFQEVAIDTPYFRHLLEPDGRVYFASAALSQTPGWQEGGIASARAQITKLALRAAAETPARKAA